MKERTDSDIVFLVVMGILVSKFIELAADVVVKTAGHAYRKRKARKAHNERVAEMAQN